MACLVFATPAFPTEEVPWFREVAGETGLHFVHFNGMSGRLYYVEVVGAGGALLDIENDGDLDVFLVQGAMLGADRTPADAILPWRGGPLTDRLYRNDLEIRTDGSRHLRFTDITGASGIDERAYGMGAIAGDVDNDGSTDLYVLNYGQNQLWHSNGDGTFSDATARSGAQDSRWSVSGSFADFDRDGWLDLFVVNYLDYSLIANKTCLTERGEPDYCLPSAYRPAASGLYRNRGDGTFEDVSARAGIAAAPGNGLGVVSGDFDGNGWVDFWVANDLMPNHMWFGQDDGSFREDGLAAGVALDRAGKALASMGVAAGDLDADGDLDLFTTHFRRETNTLYRNSGGGFFEDSTEGLALGAPSWDYTSFGTQFFDYDNDGWLDLLVVSGAVTFPPGVDRSRNPFPLDEINQLFRNLEGRRFEEVTREAGPAFALSEISRGALIGDLDNDGDADAVITNNSGPARLLLNEVGSERGWLGLRLVSGPGARDALGAVVRAPGTSPLLLRVAQSDGSYASSSDPRVLLGLGVNPPQRVSIEVLWPDDQGATKELFRDLEIGRYHRLERGRGQAPP